MGCQRTVIVEVMHLYMYTVSRSVVSHRNLYADTICRRGALGCMRNRKTEEKIIQNRRTAKKLVQNRKPHTKQSKANKMVISGAYKANYANSYFIKVFVNVMDLS